MLEEGELNDIAYLLTHPHGHRPGSPTIPGHAPCPLTLDALADLIKQRPYLLEVALPAPHASQMLVVATKSRYVAAVSLLLSLGANVNALDPFGFTPLHIAIRTGGKEGLEVATLLLKHGADVNARDGSYHKTPLLYACREMATDTAMLLIEVIHE